MIVSYKTLSRAISLSLLFSLAMPLVIGMAQEPSVKPATTGDAARDDRSVSLTKTVQTAIIKQTDEFRQSHGLAALKRDEHLMQAAAKFASFMAETSKYGHRANGKTPAERAVAAGYDYCVVRENIAYRTNTGDVTAASLIDVFVQGWIDSPPHRENMLADYVTQTGVAVATTDDVTYYAVQMFGRPESAAFQLKLTNDSDETQTIVFQANEQKDEVKLQPRMFVTMTRCFPTKVSLAGSGEFKKVDSDTTFSVTTAGLVAKDQ